VDHIDQPRPAVRVAIPERWTQSWSQRPSASVLRVGGSATPWMSADELDSMTRSMAGGLARRGVGRGDRVAWQSDAESHSVVAALAVLRLGAVLVPLSAAQSGTERRTVLKDVDPVLLIAPGDLAVQGDVARCDAAELLGGGQAVPAEGLGEAELALIIYTSGTTGHPKGAMLTHGNLAAGIDALIEAWALCPDDRLVSALPLFHVHGLVVALFGVLSAGGAVDLLPRFGVGSYLEATSAPGATLAFCVPTMLHRMARDGDVAALRGLRLLVSGSAPLSVALFEEFRSRAGQTILERYGMTETLLTVSNPLEGPRRAGTVGLALPGVVLDAPAPLAEAAELKVAGPTVFAGYWNRHDATVEVLHGGWMSTGDLVRVDEAGFLVVCGRSKELIISGGFNVYPSEIEDVLRGRSGIIDAAVVGRPSAEWGEEVVAFVVLDGSGQLDVEALNAELSGLLSRYKVPRRFEVVAELPRNALGKLQRHLL
jgi:malonyl-CoA/methylmalonyl-CoA synthetase